MSDIAAEGRALMREALKGSLATLDSPTGAPYASLVTLATDAQGAPIFLISTLARHTRNLLDDPRASILIDGTNTEDVAEGADPLQGIRLTLSGRAEKVGEEAVRRRFLARQPQAEFYADFPDFSFWRLKLESAHFIGGFGRIVDLAADELLLSLEGADALTEAEADIVAHMNEDHADAVALYAEAFAEGSPSRSQGSGQGPSKGVWRMTGLDPEGCDLVAGAGVRRVPFARQVLTPQSAREELVRLVNEVRRKMPPS